MLYDKLGHVQMASESYLMAMTACRGDPQGQLTKSATYKKAGTNYAVTLEKLGQRETAVGTLSALKDTFGNEVRVYNNLGIIQKRTGDGEGALASYEAALRVDGASFFPNYNLGVLLSQEKRQPAESLVYFKRALDQAHKAQEQLYEINVLVNIALIHEGQENLPAAIEHMEKALKIDPANTKLQAKLKQLQAGSGAKVSQFSLGVEQAEKVRMQNRPSDLTRIAPGRAAADKGSPSVVPEADLLGAVEASDPQPSATLEQPAKSKAGVMDSMLSRASALNPRAKVYEDADIDSPRAKTETASNYDRLDLEENDRMVESRKGTIESSSQAAGEDAAEERKEEPEGA